MWDPPLAESSVAGATQLTTPFDQESSLPDPRLSLDLGAADAGRRGSGNPELSPRMERPSGSTSGTGGALCIHPQRWTEDQVRAWWERRTRRRKDIGVPSKGTDGKNIMRWPISRFEQLCNGNAGIAVALYQDLRNEIERYEQWRKICLGLEQDGTLPSPAVSGPLSSPRAESTRRCRVAETQTGKQKPRSPTDPIFGSNGAASSGASPGRRTFGGSFAVPVGGPGSGQEVRRATTHGVAPCQRAQAQAKASFKFSPGSRVTETQPVAQRRTIDSGKTLRETGGRASPSASTSTSNPRVAATKEVTPSAGRKARVKSAPRASRMPATPQAANQSPPVAHEKVRLTASDRMVPAPAVSGSMPPGCPVVGQCPDLNPKAVVKKTERASVTEDLRDETKAQDVGLASSLHGRHGASRDDSAITQRPKHIGVEAPEEEEGRRMFDKRLLRRRHKDVFDQTLAMWRVQNLHDASSQASESAPSRVRVCVRKRPLFEKEIEEDEFDVISVRRSELIVHNCLTKADLRSLFISHMGFPFSRTFGAEASDDQVYAECAAPAVEHVLSQGVATIFMFGQTGSGKTHTMTGLIRRSIRHMFEGISAEGEAPMLSLIAFEIAGKTIRDLQAGSEPKEIKIMEDKGHRTRVLGVNSSEAHSTQELIALFQECYRQRTTRATQVNDTSSRSHAVYRIYLSGYEGVVSSSSAVLTLVDCAGSERREDSSHHDSQSRKDAAEINSTIFALKECFRVMRSSKGQQPPYRESLLTRVLADSFASEHALIVAIGTVSPSASDTEHSIGTLRALQQLQGTQMSFESREDVLKPKSHEELPHPRNWTEDEVRSWVDSALNGRAKVHTAGITKGTDGKNLVRWPMTRFTQLCGGDDDLGARLYQDLRQKIRSAGA